MIVFELAGLSCCFKFVDLGLIVCVIDLSCLGFRL